jgi:hypothetical protein
MIEIDCGVSRTESGSFVDVCSSPRSPVTVIVSTPDRASGRRSSAGGGEAGWAQAGAIAHPRVAATATLNVDRASASGRASGCWAASPRRPWEVVIDSVSSRTGARIVNEINSHS